MQRRQVSSSEEAAPAIAGPRVTIGMPVFDGEAFLREALDSVLAQSFRDFEVVLSDNGSQDATPEICRDYVRRDARLRYFRSASNRGAAWNFNRVVELARGSYFMWLAHDDRLMPDYLQHCVSVLDEDPAIAVCYSRFDIIDREGQKLETPDFKLPSDSLDPIARYRCLVHADHKQHLATEIFGLMRTELLRATPCMAGWAHADRCLLLRLALLGRFQQVPRCLIQHRRHSGQSMAVLPQHVGRGSLLRMLSRGFAERLGTGPMPPTEWFDPRKRDCVSFPDWRRARDYFSAITASPLGWRAKLRCRAVAVSWVLKNSPRLARDLLLATDVVLSRSLRVSRWHSRRR